MEQRPHVPGTDKRPDYRIEGRIFDNYAPETRRARNIWSNIQEKVDENQASRIVLNLDDCRHVGIDELRAQARWPIAGLQEVLVVRHGQVGRLFP